MDKISLVLYIAPIIFSIVAVAFGVLWYLKIAEAWEWSAGFAQTAAGFVVSTFLPDPTLAAFLSGLIFIGAAYCYASGILVHFSEDKRRGPRIAFMMAYTTLLSYCVFVERSLVEQLFLTDAGFAIMLGWAILAVVRKAKKPIDIALLATTFIVFLDSIGRATFFTFFGHTSSNLGDFATSAYNLEVGVSTITVCMLFPFSALGAIAAAAVDKHRTASETDPLTGLLNRHGFSKALNAKIKGPMQGAVIACDIDHFKNINDTLGHDIGDRVIAGVGGEIGRLAAVSGLAARYGGEEFVVFLPNANASEAAAIAELIRASVANLSWEPPGPREGVTISCGVATLQEEQNALEEAIRRADRALYSAKAAGRNRVGTQPERKCASSQRPSPTATPSQSMLRHQRAASVR